MMQTVWKIIQILVGWPLALVGVWALSLVWILGISLVFPGLMAFYGVNLPILTFALAVILPLLLVGSWAYSSFKQGQWYFALAEILGVLGALLTFYALSSGLYTPVLP